MKEFWALAGNSLKRRNLHNGVNSHLWWKVLLIFILALNLSAVAYSIHRGGFPPYALLNTLPVLLVLSFTFSLGSIQREWKGQTVSWWLSLPYSRSKLLLAKLVGNFLRVLKISVWLIAFMAIVAVIGRVLNPSQWTVALVINFFQSWLILYIMTLVVSPLTMSLGMLLAVTSKACRPLIPVVWGLALTLIIFAINYINPFNSKGPTQLPLGPFPVPSLSSMAFKAIVMVLIAVIVFSLSSYVLSEQTEL